MKAPSTPRYQAALENSAVQRSYVAMFLSVLLPGLGHLYLGQSGKAFFLFLVFGAGLGLFYLNSLPVTEWGDLTRFAPRENVPTEDTDPETPYAVHLWTFDDREKLMFRPSWKIKLSATAQVLICWGYAVFSGWQGRRLKT